MSIPSGNYLTDLLSQQDTLLGLQATYASVIASDAAALAAVLANPKPTYDIDGQMVAWGEYAAMLQHSIEQMQNAIKTNMESLDLLNTLILKNQPYQYWSKATRGYGWWGR